MTALATTSETLAAQTPSGRSFTLWALLGFLGSWVYIRTSSRLIRSPKVDWWPGKRQDTGRAAHRTTWFGAPCCWSSAVRQNRRRHGPRAGRFESPCQSAGPRAARSVATRRRQRLWGVAGAVAPRAGPRPHRTTSGRA